MQAVREFLENSTIHGLAHISTTRSLVRLLWFSVVLGGFIGAGVLIHQSFAEWSSSPVSTTIETLSISQLDFPNVTVCPARNSFTSLLPVLVRARNLTFDSNMRSQFAYDVPDVVYNRTFDHKHEEYMEYNKEGHYRQYYTGETKELFK